MRLLYYCPASRGGIADYAREQASALTGLGVEVTFLCSANFPLSGNQIYKVRAELKETGTHGFFQIRLLRILSQIFITLSNVHKLVQLIRQDQFSYVLFASPSQFLAPLWAGRLKKLVRSGVKFGAVIHDPVRDPVLGPLWWHRWSIARSYSFLREAFVHEMVALETICPVPLLRVNVLPHGPYKFPPANMTRLSSREALDLEEMDKVMLSFGHVRDSKNLELVIRAMTFIADVYLVVAGERSSTTQQPISYYQELADKLGVADRCRWVNRFLTTEEVADIFIAADIVLLTYNRQFRSASGVLNTAVGYRKPCVASGGEGNLKTVVRNYELGVWVEPDSIDAIVNGINQVFLRPLNSQWHGYEEENSWGKNAQSVLESFMEIG